MLASLKKEEESPSCKRQTFHLTDG